MSTTRGYVLSLVFTLPLALGAPAPSLAFIVPVLGAPTPAVEKNEAVCHGASGAASCAELVKAEKKKEEAFNIAVSLGFHGDRTSRAGVLGEGGQADELTRRVSNVSLGFSVDRGTFPHELRVSSTTKFRDEDGKTTEDVSRALFQYDYHPRHDWQVFAFAERFTDSFLAIDQRWEVGLGGGWEGNLAECAFKKKDEKCRKSRKLSLPSAESGEHDLFHPVEAGLTCKRRGGNDRHWYRLTREGYRRLEAWSDQFEAATEAEQKLEDLRSEFCSDCGKKDKGEGRRVQALMDGIAAGAGLSAKPVAGAEGCENCTESEKAVLAQLDGLIKAARAKVKSMRTEFCGQHARSLEKRYAFLQPAFSAAVLVDFEEATLKECQNAVQTGGELSTCGVEGAELGQVGLDSTQRIRLSLRPSLTIRPVSALTVRMLYFWKTALDSPSRVDGERDVREEGRLEIELKASSLYSVTFTADWQRDNVPPRGVATLTDGSTVGLTALRDHWVYDMSVKVSL